MAAPQIPNLLYSLRKSRNTRGGGGIRGRSREEGSDRSTDAVIQQTDDDAAGSRISAVDVGYLSDPFARMMMPSQQSVRRMPIINRGTYVRTTAIDALITDFLRSHADRPVQVVSLGAGTDTRPFRLLHSEPELASRLCYHELDFATCTARKITALSNSDIAEELGLEISKDKSSISSAAYKLDPLDLRTLAIKDQNETANGIGSARHTKLLSGVDATRPTLLLSECCLTYIDSETTKSILQGFLGIMQAPTPLCIVLYEPINPHDAFGRTMTSNLSARGISLPGLRACPTLDTQQDRLRQCGFDRTGGLTVKDWWRSRIPETEKERLMSLEGLDEEEEWDLLAGHYCFAWASRGDTQWPKQ